MPGIVDVAKFTVKSKKSLHSVADLPHKNIKLLMQDTRMPIQKGVSKAFPSPKKHFKMASKWMQSFTVMESRANEERNKTQREFFDRPLTNPIRLPRKAGLIAPPKPMEVYHKITPVRSI